MLSLYIKKHSYEHETVVDIFKFAQGLSLNMVSCSLSEFVAFRLPKGLTDGGGLDGTPRYLIGWEQRKKNCIVNVSVIATQVHLARFGSRVSLKGIYLCRHDDPKRIMTPVVHTIMIWLCDLSSKASQLGVPQS